jgi:hypothetical protein
MQPAGDQMQSHPQGGLLDSQSGLMPARERTSKLLPEPRLMASSPPPLPLRAPKRVPGRDAPVTAVDKRPVLSVRGRLTSPQ